MNKSETYKLKLAAMIAKRKAASDAEVIALEDNESYMDVQASTAIISEELTVLNKMMTQLNSGITPFIAKDGTKYQVRVFPVSAFGIGIDRVIGIIQGAGSAFTDEMAMEYEAITGIDFVELTIANTVMDKGAYIDKTGTFVDGTEGDLEKFTQLFQSICLKLGLRELLISDEELSLRLDKYLAKSLRLANKKQTELKAERLLNEGNDFTLED